MTYNSKSTIKINKQNKISPMPVNKHIGSISIPKATKIPTQKRKVEPIPNIKKLCRLLQIIKECTILISHGTRIIPTNMYKTHQQKKSQARKTQKKTVIPHQFFLAFSNSVSHPQSSFITCHYFLFHHLQLSA